MEKGKKRKANLRVLRVGLDLSLIGRRSDLSIPADGAVVGGTQRRLRLWSHLAHGGCTSLVKVHFVETQNRRWLDWFWPICCRPHVTHWCHSQAAGDSPTTVTTTQHKGLIRNCSRVAQVLLIYHNSKIYFQFWSGPSFLGRPASCFKLVRLAPVLALFSDQK